MRKRKREKNVNKKEREKKMNEKGEEKVNDVNTSEALHQFPLSHQKYESTFCIILSLSLSLSLSLRVARTIARAAALADYFRIWIFEQKRPAGRRRAAPSLHLEINLAWYATSFSSLQFNLSRLEKRISCTHVETRSHHRFKLKRLDNNTS